MEERWVIDVIVIGVSLCKRGNRTLWGLRHSTKRPNCSIAGISGKSASMALEEAFAFITDASKA
jgi:hypothetical protein